MVQYDTILYHKYGTIPYNTKAQQKTCKKQKTKNTDRAMQSNVYVSSIGASQKLLVTQD